MENEYKSIHSNTKAIIFNIQLYTEYESVDFHLVSRKTELYCFREITLQPKVDYTWAPQQ